MRNDNASANDWPRWLKTDQAAKYLQMRRASLIAKANTGEIASYIRGNTRFFNADDLDAYMRSQPSGAKVPAVLQAS